MKYLPIIISCLLALNLTAQEVVVEYPYNPDFENDGNVGVEDLMQLLASFGMGFEVDEINIDELTLSDWISLFNSALIEQQTIIDSLSLYQDSNLALWDSIETLQVQLQLLEAEMDSMVLGQYDSDLNELMTSITALESAVELINFGCTDDTACNFDPEAEIDDDSCEGLLGCTDSQSNNFDLNATCDDGSCNPYVGMYGYGGVVYEVSVDLDWCWVVNVHDEPVVEIETSLAQEALNALSTQGYTDWGIPSPSHLGMICESQDLINETALDVGGLTLSGYYLHHVIGCGGNVGGQNVWSYGSLQFTNCSLCSCCPDVETRLRAVRWQSL